MSLPETVSNKMDSLENIEEGQIYTSFGIVNIDEINNALKAYEDYLQKQTHTLPLAIEKLQPYFEQKGKVKKQLTFPSMTCAGQCSSSLSQHLTAVPAGGGKKRKSQKK